MMIPFDRRAALRWSSAGLGVALLCWYAQVYAPAVETHELRAADESSREARVHSARAAMVEIGPDGLDSLVAGFGRDSALLSARIPPADAAAALAAEVKEALSQAERRFGARITASEPLQISTEGPFHAGGYAVRVVGRYADVGALLTSVANLPRLTRLRGLRLHAVPDSLVRSAAPYGASAATSPFGPDSTGAAVSLADAGEVPFTAVASFHLIWFTLPHGAPPVDSVGLSTPDTGGAP